MTVSTRDARASDAETVAPMVRALNLGLGWETCTFGSDDFRRDAIGPERWVDFLVAESEGAIVGYAMFHRSYDTETVRRGTYLTDLYVTPEARGSGAGVALMRAVAHRTRDWGGDVVWWLTTADNDLGNAFYERRAQHVPGIDVWVAEGDNFEALLE